MLNLCNKRFEYYVAAVLRNQLMRSTTRQVWISPPADFVLFIIISI